MFAAPPTPIVWRATQGRVVDGDTVRLFLERDVQLDSGHVATVRPGRLELIRGTVPSAVLHDVAVRLVTLDTPERGQPGWREATADVLDWPGWEPWYDLALDDYGPSSHGRLLGDLYVAGDRSDTLTAYMLRRGWEPWVPPHLRDAPRHG